MRKIYSSYLPKALFAIGLFFILTSITSYFNAQKFLSSSTKTTGKIIELKRGGIQMKTSTGYYPHAPVFEYIDNENNPHVIVSGVYSHPPQYEVGDTVEVLFSADNPDKTEIYSFFNMWGRSIAFLALGGFAILFGFLLSFLLKQER